MGIPRRSFLRGSLAAGLGGVAGCSETGGTGGTPTRTPGGVDSPTDDQGSGEFSKPRPASWSDPPFPALQQGGTVNVGGEQETYDESWVVINPARVTETTSIEGVTEVSFSGERWHSFLLSTAGGVQPHYRMHPDGEPTGFALPIPTDDGPIQYNIYVDDDVWKAVSHLRIIANDSGRVVDLGQFLSGETFHGVSKNVVLGPSDPLGTQLYVGDYEDIPSEPLGLRADDAMWFSIEG